MLLQQILALAPSRNDITEIRARKPPSLQAGEEAPFFAQGGEAKQDADVSARTVRCTFLPSSIGIIRSSSMAWLTASNMPGWCSAAPRVPMLCEELTPDIKEQRRLQRKMERQRRANNPQHYDVRGRPKKRGKGGLRWRRSHGYEATRRRKAAKERKLAAHRKSLHGRLAHEIVAQGPSLLVNSGPTPLLE